MKTCRVELLGSPRLLWGGEVLRFSAPPKTLPLLAYVVLHGECLVPRDVAARAVWGDACSDARANLRRHLAYLKAAIPPSSDPWIRTTVKTLEWNDKSSGEIDVVEFERLSHSEEYERAIPLYRGDLMERYSFEWLEGHRSRFRDLQVFNLQRATARAFDSGNNFLAANYAMKVLALDPLREDVVRIAVQARFALGDRIGAVRQYESFAQRLRDETKLEPLPETRAVYEQMAMR